MTRVSGVPYNRGFAKASMNRGRTFYVLMSIAYMAMIFVLSSTRLALPGGGENGTAPPWLTHAFVLLYNAAHVPLFGGFAFLVHRAAKAGRGAVESGEERGPGGSTSFARFDEPTRGSVLVTVAVVLAYSVVDEIHQSLTPGRIPSAFDIVLNAIGCAMALGVARYGWRGFRVAMLALAVVAVVVIEVGDRLAEHERWFWRTVSQRITPIDGSGRISSFASERRWGPFPPDDESVTLEVVSRDGERDLAFGVPADPEGFRGVRSKSMPVDWRGVRAVRLDLDLDSAAPVSFALGLHPFFEGATFHVQRIVPPGSSTVRFDLDGFTSAIDPRSVREVRLFVRRPDSSVQVRLHDLYVER